MMVWGGVIDAQAVATGGLYDPAKDAWTAASAMGAPSPRYSPSTVWTGSRVIVWAGYNLADWLNDGAMFDPAAGPGGSWVGATATENAPKTRESAVAAWGASRMIVWGGWTGGPYEGTGGMFDPSAGAKGAWTTMSTESAPSPRGEHAGIWTGSELIVWGGCGEDLCAKIHGDGGRFTPGGDGGRWTPIEEQGALPARRGHTAVTTGSSIIVWGGRVGSMELLNTGAESLF
jgi:hypothetical protein